MLTRLWLVSLLAASVPAQMELDGLGTPAPLSLSAPQLRWSRPVPAGTPDLALGERGTHAYLVSGGQLELLSAFDQHPPQPVWVSPYNWASEPFATAASDDRLLLAHTELFGGSSLLSTLRCFRSGAPEPLWSLTLPPQFFAVPLVGVSRDGQVLVSLLDDFDTAEHQIRVHDPLSGAVTAQFNAPIETSGVRFGLAPDGHVLAHSHADGSGFTTLRGVANGAVLLHTPGSLPEAQGLSHDGRVVITREHAPDDSWTVRVQVHSAGVWTTSVEATTPGDMAPLDMAVSEDGRLAVAGWRDPLELHELLIKAWDTTTGALVFERTPGAGVQIGFQTYENHLSDLALSADGSRLAMGSWGTGPLGPAELVVWDVPGDTQLASFPLGGSVKGIDLAADGQRLLVHRLAKHTLQGSNPSSVEFYDLGGADLTIDGVPGLGGSVTLDVAGTPGTSAWLLLASDLLPAPVQAGSAGLLALDPDSLVLLPAGSVAGNGLATLALGVPALPSLVGLQLHTQGATAAPLTLGHSSVALTVLPGS